MIAIILALQWVEETKPSKAVVCSDSMSSLTSILSGRSSSRQDLLEEIHQIIYKITQQKTFLQFFWVPAHRGIQGNEAADKLAKEATGAEHVELEVPLSRSEMKIILKENINKLWQDRWDQEERGRHLYSLQKKVGIRWSGELKRREEVWITRLRIGHTGLNSGLHIVGKHQTGACMHCGEREGVGHVLVHCSAYSNEREKMQRAIKTPISLSTLLSAPNRQTAAIVRYLMETGLANRI